MRPAVYLVVAAVALALRAAYFAAHLASPLVDVPVLDARYFDLFSRTLAAGEVEPGLATGFRPLLYPRLLALVYRVAGEWDLYAALALQHLVGVGTALLVAAAAARQFASERAAFAAGLLFALAGPPLFFEGELLVETLFLAAVAAQLLAFVAADGAGSRWALAYSALAGGLGGASVHLRPNHLLFLLALPLVAWFRSQHPGGPMRRRTIAATLGAALVTLLGLAALDAPLLGRFQLVPSAGGVNLFLGNARGADGMIPRQGFAVAYGDEYRDSVEVFAERDYRRAHGLAPEAAIAPAAMSRYWLGRSWAELEADPLGRAQLLGRKLLLLLWNREIPNNRSFEFAAHEETPLLAFAAVRWWLLLALAAMGLVALRQLPLELRLRSDWAVAFLVIHALGVVLFFVNDRYRLPLWPALAILAGGGVAALTELRSGRERGKRLKLATVGGVVAISALVNWTGTTPPGPARDLFFRSVARLDRGDAAGALVDAEASARLEPHEGARWVQVGNAALELGQLERAERSYTTARERLADDPSALTGLGVVRERQERWREAHALHCRALAAHPGYAPALLNAAALERRAGLAADAERHLAAVTPRARRSARAKRLETEAAPPLPAAVLDRCVEP